MRESGRKIFDRILAVLLTAMMIVSMLPINIVFAVETDNKYGTVSTFTGGDITGNKTDKVSVEVKTTTLQWVEKNDARPVDGWWVGIKAEAPEGYSANATFKHRNGTTGDYGAANSFADNKDGDDYIELWFLVTPEKLNEALAAHDNVTVMFIFDWDGNEEYEQEITFSVVPGDNIVLTKDGEQIYPVDLTAVKIEGYSDKYDGKEHAVNVEATGFTVKYSEDNITFSGTSPVIKDVGSKNVYVQLSKADYVILTEEVELKVEKADITGISISPTTNKYVAKENGEGTEYEVATLNGNKQDGDTVTYIVEGDSNVYASIPKKMAVGKYKVTLKVDRGSNYNVFTQTVTSEIELGDIELGGIKVQGLEGEYTGAPQEVVSHTDEGNYSLKYKLDDGEWISTIPTVTDAGSYTVQVKATKTNYNDKDVTVDKAESAVYPFNVYIAKAEQTGFEFTNKTPSPLAYNGTLENEAKGGLSGGTITYEVVDGAEYVSVDQNGKITAIKARGEATIKATKSGKSSDGKENYNDATATYTVKTVRAEQADFVFPENEYTVYYGTRELKVGASGGQSGGDVTYEITDDPNGIASVTSSDNEGTVTFKSGKTKGKFKVKATLEGNDNYNDATAETEVTVDIKDFSEHLTVPTAPESGWFTEDVVLTPVEGYKISTSISFDADWEPSYTVSHEGENKDITVYLRENETGYIGEAISVGTIYLDKSAPEAVQITYSISIRDMHLGEEYCGFYQDEATVTFKATDKYSGVKCFEYRIGMGETQTVEATNGIASITVPANLSKSLIVVKAIDDADNKSAEVNGDKKIVVDNTDPEISVSYGNDVAVNDKYFSGPRTATIKIKEENFLADHLYEEVYINNEDGTPVAQGYNYLTIKVGKRLNNEDAYTDIYEEPSFVFNEKTGDYVATVEFADDADYTLDIKYFDPSTNENTKVDFGESEAPTEFTVDKSKPTCDVKIKTSTWDKFLSIITFGLYSKDSVTVDVVPYDATAGVEKTVYYKYNGDEGLTKETLEDLYQKDLNSEEEKSFNVFDKAFAVNDNEQFVIYVRVEDKAGNYEYFSSDGYIVDTDESKITLEASEAYAKVDNVNVYGKGNSVSVGIEVSDAVPYSGIKSVKYQIIEGETVTKEETLFSFDYTREDGEDGSDGKNTNGGELKITGWDSETQTNTITETYTGNVPTKGQLVNEWSGTVNIDKEANNSSNVKFSVIVEDNAGNISESSINLDIDITAPAIDVSFEDVGYNQTVDGRGYFGGENAGRVATVKFTERTNHFDKVAAEKWITDNIEAVDMSGKAVSGTYTVEWNDTVEGTTPDDAVHTATVTFSGDANYKWTSKDEAFSDKAGNENTAVTTGNSVTPWSFTVDKTAPTSMKIVVESADLVAADQTTLVYNRFYQTDINSILEANFDVSGMESMQYQIVRPTDEYKEDGAWIDYDAEAGISAYPTDKFVIYFRAEDRAGNVSIVRSTGIVVDDKAPIGETNAPEIDIIPNEANENGFHNGNVDVKIKVVDPKYKGQTGDAAGYYSGLNTIKYKITATDTNAVEEGVLLSPSTVTGIATVDSDGLTSAWAGNITVDSTRFNSNKVIVEIYAVDNAGNERTSKTSDGDIQIDITAPTIEVSYDNNDVDSETYFKADRTATIVVTERNFDPKKVNLRQTNTDGAVPALSEWVKTEGTGNADDTKWTATIVYNTDGDYEFEIACTDLAGWTCNEDGVNYGVSVAPRAFTVDKTIPVVTTSYDNNVYENPYYFKETRMLTIVVTEHNFDASRFTTTTTGQGMTEWTHDGDTHTARIAFTSDNSYTFNCTYKDMAGNEAEAREDESFVIDLTPPTVRLEDSVKGTAPEEKAAYNGEVNFAVYYGDINIDMNKVVVTLTDSVGNDVESTLLTAAEATGDGFVRRIIDTVEQRQIPDGIYTLNVTVYDLAGNSTSIEPKIISVNRDSSSYIIGERLQQLIDKGYNNVVDGDIIISEINCCEITSAIITISCNGTPKTLTEGVDYTIRSSHDSREWYQNDYIISPSVFGGDGGYSLLIESKDGAGNSISNLSAVENVNVEFSVDKTAPVIIIKGLDEERYDESAHPLSIMYEDNLRLDRIEVKVTIRGKEEVTVYSVDELGLDVVAGEVEHVLKEASDRQQITVVAYDKAGNESEVITDSAVVSTSAWVRYITNPVALVLTGVGVFVAATVIIIPIIIVKKKKKEEETETANAR